MLPSPGRSQLFSILLHAAAIVLILAVTGVKSSIIIPRHEVLVAPILPDYRPPLPRESEGGGGGGKQALTPASRGDLPKLSPRPFVPPAVVILNENPKLSIEPAILADSEIKIPTLNLGVLGDPNGVAGPPSDGRGKCCGIGDGEGDGVGNKKGPGYGNGPPGAISGRSGIEGTVTPPELVWKTEPQYTEEARRAKLQGTVILQIEIDQHGKVQTVSVRQSLGLGLDDRAIDTVRSWRFRPGRKNGQPVVTTAYVEVNFRLL